MRIVGGRFKGHGLAGPKSQAIRPTSDRLRESLFNILEHGYEGLEGLRVIDLFAGTGAFAFEALSRGAVYAALVDDSAEARGLIRANAEALGVTGIAQLLKRDATRLGPVAPLKPFDLAFLDPPYGKGLAEKALASLLAGGWLVPGALVLVEESAKAEVTLPEGVEALETRGFGETQVVFGRVSGAKAGEP